VTLRRRLLADVPNSLKIQARYMDRAELVLPNKTFVASRTKSMALFLVSIAFVAIAVFLPQTPSGSGAWRVGAAAFFGLGALVFAWLLVRPQRLILDSDGFTMTGGLVISPKTIRWSDVDRFFILPLGTRMIGFTYRDRSHPALLRNLNRRATGADGALPASWNADPDKVVEELNAYRQRAG